MTFTQLLHKISIWIIILPLLAGLLTITKLSKDSRIVFALVVLATLPQLLSDISLPVEYVDLSYNLYTPVEFIILYWLFAGRLHTKKLKMIQVSSAVIYSLFCLVLFLRVGIKERFINELACLNNFIYLIWILLYIRKQSLTPDESIGYKKAFFWFFLGLMVYAPCTMIVIALFYYIREHPQPILWTIHCVCNITMYIFFAIGFLQDRHKGNVKLPVIENTTL